MKEVVLMTRPAPLVIGIGNEYRGDDGVGLIVAGKVRDLELPGVAVRLLDGEGTELLSVWRPSKAVVVVDAAHSCLVAADVPSQDALSPAESYPASGTIHRIEAHRVPVPHFLASCSTHSFGLQQAIELGRILGQLPPRLIVLAIEGEEFTPGSRLLSKEVQAAVQPAVEAVLQELEI
jgi:hydrogenase maturation protease